MTTTLIITSLSLMTVSIWKMTSLIRDLMKAVTMLAQESGLIRRRIRRLEEESTEGRTE